MSVMKRNLKILICLAALLPVAPDLSARTNTLKEEFNPYRIESLKKKRHRGYKKPKRKKFLGIFKRKSSCDCPKH